MGKLIVISNRVTMPGNNQAGGLAVALTEALRENGGMWLGWSGELNNKPQIHQTKHGKVDYVVTDMTKKDHDHYYVGFSNSTLWPLFHYRTDLVHYSRDQYEGYLRVNWKFAELVAKYAEPEDTIWVHDYHMIPMAMALRELGVKSRIGFFLHIPFPGLETLSVLPVADELIRALCAYDLVGFQTDNDLHAFMRCTIGVTEAVTSVSRRSGLTNIRLKKHLCQAGSFPISIDTNLMVEVAEDAERGAQMQALKNNLNGRQLIVGVDRMDYSKGLPARLDAYEILLKNNPQFRRKVNYTQITPTSRTEVEDYRELREQVEAKVARINGTYATLDWSPVHFLTSSFTRDELAGLYRAARVGLITPLRDGMNLVAKEYVASQNPEDPGVLVLSRFAGAASELDSALLINPYDPTEIAEAVSRALTMGSYERRERYETMMQRLTLNSIDHWTEKFLTILRGQAEIAPAATAANDDDIAPSSTVKQQ